MSASDLWGSDVPVSRPKPLRRDRPARLRLGTGMVFTSGGMAHDAFESDLERIFSPWFTPTGDLPERGEDG